MRRQRRIGLLAVLLGCGPVASDDSQSSGGTTTGSTTSSTGNPQTAGSVGSTSAETTGGTGSVSDSGSASTGSTDGVMPSMLECDGQVWQCGDLEDNDGDGLVDFEDPDCINPCDDAEDGLPPRNFTVIDYNDCNRECFFDANTGVGDDQCLWNLKCDPENPGQDVACEYSDSNNCSNLPGTQTPECRAFCEPAVFPGCDCFGCCVIETTGGERGIYLDGGPDCSFDNLDACASCTPQIESCGNPCDRSSCERCFGDFELPPGCEVNTCDNGDSCNATSDCPDSYFCAWGCCYPPPPG